MIPSIASILDDLRPCFSRQAAFEWFVIIIFGRTRSQGLNRGHASSVEGLSS